MPTKYYDVIVIGRSLGALTAAALLARRDFTVLVIGQGRRSADYSAFGRKLRRRAFTMLAASSPVWARVMRELAHTQTWRRRVVALDPMLQVLVPGVPGRGPAAKPGPVRIDVPPDTTAFAREIERELPDARRLVADLYSDFARVTAAADECFESDAMWPPGTFFERRETLKVVSRLPFARAEPHADLLADFPKGHVYRRIVAESVRFATDFATLPPAFAVARLHAAWTRGVWALVGGEDELEQLLLERITANGGELALSDRAVGLEVRRSVAAGVQVDHIERPIGAGFVISDRTGEDLANLSGGEGISKRAQRDWPRITPSTGRFVVSLVVRSAGVPAPLGREALLLPGERAQGLAARAIHLQRAALLDDSPRGSGVAPARSDEELLVAEMLLSERDLSLLRDARQLVVDRLCAEMPFLDKHLVIVDSAHDGLPVWMYQDGARRDVERTELMEAARTEPMDRQIEVDPPGFLGVSGDPVRGPIERTLLCGMSVLPGLGQEGQLLAACSAARLVTKSDRRKARMRREMWTKMEIE
jgi:phytoene dehydrogenase-like protein